MFLTQLTNLFVFSIYTTCLKDMRRAWFWPTRETWYDWGPYLNLGLNGAFMYFLEFLVYEIVVLFAGLIGVEELSVTTLMMNFGGFMY